MPLTGDTARFHLFVRELRGIGKPGSALHRAIMQEVKREVQARIKDQFKRGVGPDDRKHPPRKDGKPALVSRKLGNAARARVSGSSLWVEPKTQKVAGILDTHQDGHTFPARSGKVHQYRDRKGRLISYRKFVKRIQDTEFSDSDKGNLHTVDFFRLTKAGKLSRKGTRMVTTGVKFGRRSLPARPIRPIVGALTRPWSEAVGRGLNAGAEKQIGKFAE